MSEETKSEQDTIRPENVAGAAIAAVAAVAAATQQNRSVTDISSKKKVSSEEDTSSEEEEENKEENVNSNSNGTSDDQEHRQQNIDTPINNLFLDNLHLFFGDKHLNHIKDIINPSHQLSEKQNITLISYENQEKYEHNRLMNLLRKMFFNQSKGTISKVFKGGGITIEQLKTKIKKGISMIVPK